MKPIILIENDRGLKTLLKRLMTQLDSWVDG